MRSALPNIGYVPFWAPSGSDGGGTWSPHRAQIYSSQDGLDMIRARRIRSEVEAALADLDTVRVREAERVAAARRRMAEAAARLVPYGPLATEATGCSLADLRRLAAAVRNH
ncbi:MAG: hypothetical protein ACYCV5_11995 [Acidimicrobiales bacterium]